MVPGEQVAPLLRDNFVSLASDIDAPEAEVMNLLRQIPDARMLPFVVFSDSEGNYLQGHSGMLPRPQFVELIQKALG